MPIIVCPISPLDSSIPGVEESAEALASMDDALLEDKIIGTEMTTLDDHGPGALVPNGLPSPHRMLPAKEAIHWLTHLPYDPACELCVQCKGRTLNIAELNPTKE